MPLVSVLLPVRDAASTLDEALDSLLADPLRDLEVIAVDDGSRDESGAVLECRARADRRVVVERRPREGLVPALQHGLARCRGRYVARHDADDVSVPGRLEDQARRLAERPEVEVLSTRCEIFRDDGPVRLGMRRWAAWTNALLDDRAMRRDRFVESPLAHPTVMMPIETLHAAGGYRDGDFPEDYELWLRLFAAGVRFEKLPRVGVRVRDHGGRSIRTQPRYRPEAFRALKIEHLKREVLRDGEPVLVMGGGRIAKGWLRALQAAGVAVAALIDVNPRRVGRTVHGVPVIWPEASAAGAPYGEWIALGAVSRPGGRGDIRALLPRLGREEGRDFWFVA